MIHKLLLQAILQFVIVITVSAQVPLSKVWVADNGDGTYKNPVLNADYSDPDVCRAGSDYYLVSSSFNCIPGLPVLHSRDLVNWRIIGHVIPSLEPPDVFSKPQHGNGIWAPSIRFHNDEFYVFYPDPDYGIFMVKTKDPAGQWSKPVQVMEGKGLIDPCPFWDDNGNAYLIHAFAGSRAGIKSILVLYPMNSEGTGVTGNGVLVFDGHDDNSTVEGPKMYKRNGYYYIFAPAGGVATGWQLVLRSKKVYGPYEKRIVMDKGKTQVNGPHQGAWVDTPKGESWFIHFQDAGPYGRVVHLQPVKWINDWPVIGNDPDGDGKGEPVLTYKMPDTGSASQKSTPSESDEFNDVIPGLQWQWHANPERNWSYSSGAEGFLRLYAAPVPESFLNFWDVPNLFLQKFPARAFTATVKMNFKPRIESEKAGLIVMGTDYAYISVKQSDKKIYLSQTFCLDADKKGTEKESQLIPLSGSNIWLRVKVEENAVCTFSYSTDGKEFLAVGKTFTSKPGKWIGAKTGLFCVSQGTTNDSGYADIDWFRVE
jgi:beta-xylosidase